MNERLKRFHDQQDHIDEYPFKETVYQKAYREIAAGMKTSHWIWYIFPQLKSLGYSSTAKEYGISDFNEACDYLRDPILFTRYYDMVKLVADKLAEGIDVLTLMGSDTDAKKLASSLTLFQLAAQKLAESEKKSISPNFSDLNNYCTKVLSTIAHQNYGACAPTKMEIEQSLKNLFKSSSNSSFALPPMEASSPKTEKVTEASPEVTQHSSMPVGTASPVSEESIKKNQEGIRPLSTDNALILKTIVEKLMSNIQQKADTRASWFTLNSENKIKKLHVISQWLSHHPLNKTDETIIVALIRDTCAIKRNIFGFFEPHSLNEFKDLLQKYKLEPPSETVSFNATDLANISVKANAVDELIQEKRHLGSYNPIH